MRRNTDERGYTLVELLMVAVILGLVMVAVYSLYLNSQRTAYTSEEVVDAQQNLRIAMDTMVSDIRMSGFLTASSVEAVASGPATLAGGNTFTISAPVSSGIYARSVTNLAISGGAADVDLDVDDLMGGSFIEADPVTTLVMDPVTLNRKGLLVVTDLKNDTTGTDTLVISNSSATDGFSVEERDILLRRAPNDDSYPVTISYSLIDDPTSDDAQLFLLQRSVNGHTAETVAAGITTVELAYLDGDGNDCSASLEDVAAVSLSITAKTEDNKIGGDKSRQLRTIVKIRNVTGV